MAAALLLLPSALGNPLAEVELTCRRVEARSALVESVAPTAVHVALGDGEGRLSFSGSEVRVDWARETVLVLRGPDGREALWREEQSSGQEFLGDASGNVSLHSPDAGLTALLGQGSTESNPRDGHVSFEPLLGGAPSSEGDLVVAAVGGGTVRLAGRFLVEPWQANVTIRAGGGLQSFRAGSWEEALEPGALGERLSRRIRQEVVVSALGHLNLETARGVRLSSPAHALTSAESTFVGARGEARIGEDRMELGPRMHTASVQHLRIEPHSGFLMARFHASAAELGLPRGVGDLVSMSPMPTALAQAASAGAALAMLGGAWLFLRSQRVPGIEAVERALLDGRLGRARRLAARRLRRIPADLDASFLLGAALLAAGRPQDVVTSISGIAAQLPRDRASGLAFELALANHELGRSAEARRWGGVAAKDPEFRRCLEGVGAAAAIDGYA